VIKTPLTGRILAFFELKTGLFRLGGHILVMPHEWRRDQHILPTPTSASLNIVSLEYLKLSQTESISNHNHQKANIFCIVILQSVMPYEWRREGSSW
jgi:hypothetical protein